MHAFTVHGLNCTSSCPRSLVPARAVCIMCVASICPLHTAVDPRVEVFGPRHVACSLTHYTICIMRHMSPVVFLYCTHAQLLTPVWRCSAPVRHSVKKSYSVRAGEPSQPPQSSQPHCSDCHSLSTKRLVCDRWNHCVTSHATH